MNKELIELEHKHKMEEIEFNKQCLIEVEKVKLECAKELQRIKNADILRSKQYR